MAAPFQPKRQLGRVISSALDGMADNIDATSAVTITGLYGEKAAVFFAQDGDEASGNDSPVGFFIASKNEPGKHMNVDRAAAGKLVALLINEFDFTVNTTLVERTVLVPETIVS